MLNLQNNSKNLSEQYILRSANYPMVWWLDASENPSSILCVVSGHLCTFLFIKTYVQALCILSIMSNKTLPCHAMPYHTISYHCQKNPNMTIWSVGYCRVNKQPL